jgi:integrase
MPMIARMTESDRGSLFSRRCRLVGVKGVSLHSYRYAWAERAKTAGFPQRFAQEALGHKSQAVHAVYGKQAQVRVPCLEDWERQMKDKVVKMEFADSSNVEPAAKKPASPCDSPATASAP